MIVLFTDFGFSDPYVGQIKAVLAEDAPGVPVIDLLHGVPDFNAHAGAHLLSALVSEFKPGSVFITVVDPGVGGPRDAVVVQADGISFVGPDNGLLSVIATRAEQVRYWRIDWRPERLSRSFHGRDLFAHVAAALARGVVNPAWLSESNGLNVVFEAGELPRILYIDHYGNAWTGLRAGAVDPAIEIEVRGHKMSNRRVFHEADKGDAFWYINSVGLVEIAVNRGNAAQLMGLSVGDTVRCLSSSNTLH